MAKACIPKWNFLHPKPADLNFKRPKSTDQIFSKSMPAFYRVLKSIRKTYISIHVPYTSTTNILFIIYWSVLKVGQSLHLPGKNWKACILLFQTCWSLQTTISKGAKDHKYLGWYTPILGGEGSWGGDTITSTDYAIQISFFKVIKFGNISLWYNT